MPVKRVAEDTDGAGESRRELNALMMQCSKGDRDALRRLYDKFSPQLFSLALRMLRDRQAAEDIVQETFLTVWKRVDRFDPTLGSAAGWMTVIARNKCLDRLRSRVQTVGEDEGGLECLPDLSPNPEEATISSDEASRVRECISHLVDRQKEAILLAYYGGLTQEETAERMNAPLGTVKSWVRRGLQHLKGCLEA